MKTVGEGLQDTSKCLFDLSRKINSDKAKKRIHKDNLFNKRFSTVLDSFSDFETIANRLEKEISEVESLNRVVQSLDCFRNNQPYTPQAQDLMKQVDIITRYVKVDFKALYMFAKIFLDQYTSLLRFLFDWRGVGDKSVTSFYKDLEKYAGSEEIILKFKSACFNRLKAIDIFITQYRDDYIVHDQTGHKETRWLLNDMRGQVRFLGNRPSIVPKELIFVVSNYVSDTANFVQTNI